MARAVKPRKSPTQDRSRLTVDAILEACARILIEDGYGGLTTNRVAELAGVSIGSLYQYFPNKEAMIVSLYERHHARVRAVMAGELSFDQDLISREGIRRLIAALVASHSIEPALHARFEALRQDDNFQSELGNGDLDPIVGKLASALRNAHGSALKNPHLSAWILVTTVHSLIHAFERSGDLCDQQTQIDEITRLVMGYMAQVAQNA